MERGLKERLTGAAVLVILAVIFIPMLLDETPDGGLVITESNIPPKPDSIPSAGTEDFSSRIIPLQEKAAGQAEEPAVERKRKADAAPPKPPVSTPEPADPPPELTVTPHERVVSSQESGIPPQGELPGVAMITEEAPTHVGLSAWVVQLGSFSSQENAQALNQKLREAGYPAFVEPLKQNDTTSYRVRVGPELKRSDAQSIRDQLQKSMQLNGIVVQYP